jgi:hypothetical protein
MQVAVHRWTVVPALGSGARLVAPERLRQLAQEAVRAGIAGGQRLPQRPGTNHPAGIDLGEEWSRK